METYARTSNAQRICLLALFAALSAGGVAAREFPQNAKRDEIKAHQYPYYKIGSQTYRLAPGGKIFNQHNMIIMPASLQLQTADVMYQLDMNGDLGRVWLLTPEEARQIPKPKPKPKPVTPPTR